MDDFSEEYSHIKVYIHSTFQALNLFHIPDLLRWTANAKWRNIHRVPHFIWLHEPRFLQAAVLPEHLKKRAIDKIKKALEETDSFFMCYNKNHWQWSKEHLSILFDYSKQLEDSLYEELLLKEFIHYTSKMDDFRKQDISQVMPEFKEIFV